MKTLFLLAALGVAIPVSAPAVAAQADQPARLGHYEWRAGPQFGPRAAGPVQKRVWVPDGKQMANCECDMMKADTTACMSPSSAKSAG